MDVVAGALVDMAMGIRCKVFDFVRMGVADSFFLRGLYERSRHHYENVREPRYIPEARKMVDWIDYKCGNVGRGWPLYPVAIFSTDLECPDANQSLEEPVIVENPNRPAELIERLGLKLWDFRSPVSGPVLIWFNLRESLGGEVFASKLALAFIRKFPGKYVLAVDARLTETLAGCAPGVEIISKGKNIAGLRGICNHFCLVKDLLGFLVRDEEDFAEIADTVFPLSPVKIAKEGAPVRVAITWKTTNRKQGIYRNIPLSAFAKCLAPFPFDYFSAQHGVSENERSLLEGVLGSRINFETIDPASGVSEIASSLQAMDIIVTIDNSILHIAGAYDMPTVALLSLPSYWAWPESGESSRFYRSVTLIHQENSRKWTGVLSELSLKLFEWDSSIRRDRLTGSEYGQAPG